MYDFCYCNCSNYLVYFFEIEYDYSEEKSVNFNLVTF